MNKDIPQRQNTENRQKLMSAAKELFYKQGYSKTTLAQISDLSGVNNGLITYYFGSKANMASEIYTGLILEIRNEIAKQLYMLKQDYKLELGIGLEQRLLLKLKFENSNFQRFYVEYQSEVTNFSSKRSEKRRHYYLLQRRLINPNLSDEDLLLYEICGYSIAQSIAEAHFTGYYDKDTVYAEDYLLKMLYTMLRLPLYQIECLVEESRFWRDKINIKIGPYFKLMT